MGYYVSLFWRGLVFFAFLLALLLPATAAFAVVGDVTLTGLPPNTSVTLTNEETKERVEQKTDDRGFVIIPLAGKNWQSARHRVTSSVDGKPVTSKIFLRDGANRTDLTALTYSARPLDPAKAQKVDEALKKSTGALKADPSNQQALLTQGAALNRLGRHGEALSKLAQATKMGSTYPALAFETGWSLMRLGMYPEAIAQLEKYEKMKPGLGQTSEFIGRSHLFLNDLDKADAKLKEALKRDPKLTSTVRFHQAILETLRKNPDAASKHIDALLKEAPNSLTAQLFKNALLQAPGAKPPAGAGAKDYKLSDPIKITVPPTTAADVAGAVAKGVVGGLLGGLFGGGRRQEPEGPNLVAKPALPETTLASKDGKTKINLSGAIEDGKPYVVMGVNESPGNGAPHLILLQDKNCNVMQPKEVSVYDIWEAWGGWKLTVSWTKSYYQDGRLVKQEKGGWSTPWNIFRTQIKDPSEIPGIWKDFGSKPFEGIREVMSSFEPSPGVPFNPADWNLITHATTDAGNNQLVTAPFVTGLGTDKDNNLTFQQRDRTVCESAPPTAPLLANMTTLPWTVGPFEIAIAPDPPKTEGIFKDKDRSWLQRLRMGISSETGTLDSRSIVQGRRFRIRKDPAPKVETSPGTTATTETRPDTTAEVESFFPNGARIEKRPDGTRVLIHPNGRIEHLPRHHDPDGEFSGTFGRIFYDGRRVTRNPGEPEVTYYPDGTTEEWDRGTDHITTRRPDGTTIIRVYHDGGWVENYPDGTRVEARSGLEGYHKATFPDGSSVEEKPDGTIVFNDPPPAEGPPAVFPGGIAPPVPGEPDVPGLEDSDNALPVDQVM